MKSNAPFQELSRESASPTAIRTIGPCCGTRSRDRVLIKGVIHKVTVSLAVSILMAGDAAKAQKVAAGDMHSVAIKSDGTVWAWGDNTFGQLGLGYETPSTAMPLIPGGAAGTPTKVLNITNATRVVSNGFQSLALTSGGSVWAWGWNGNGPLGDGTTVNRPTPFQIPSLSGVTSIAMGNVHAAATTSSGALWTLRSLDLSVDDAPDVGQGRSMTIFQKASMYSL